MLCLAEGLHHSLEPPGAREGKGLQMPQLQGLQVELTNTQPQNPVYHKPEIHRNLGWLCSGDLGGRGEN